MKIRIVILSAVLLLAIKASAQKDQQAVKILDKFSSTALNALSVSMDFDLITNDKAEMKTDTLKGSVLISGNKYRLDLPDNIVWFNGEISWSYLPAEKEVTLTKPGKRDDIFQSRPSSVFTMYKKGYKIRLAEDTGNSCIIDLYPEDLKSNLIHVRLSINKASMALNNVEYKQKDGVTRTLIVKNYDLKKKPDPSYFTYPKDKFKGVEVIDMR